MSRCGLLRLANAYLQYSRHQIKYDYNESINEKINYSHGKCTNCKDYNIYCTLCLMCKKCIQDVNKRMCIDCIKQDEKFN